MRYFTIILLIWGLASACIPSPKSSKKSAGGILRSIDSLPVRWSDERMTYPFDLRISEDFVYMYPNDNSILKIQNMMKVWDNEFKNKNIFYYYHDSSVINYNGLLPSNSLLGPPDLLKSYLDNTLGIYITTSWFKDSNIRGDDTLAVTSFYGYRTNAGYDNDYIKLEHADIIVNNEHFNFRLGNDNGVSDNYNLQTVILHELGHFLGLDHNPISETVMSPFLNHETDYYNLRPLDKQKIQELYSFSTTSTQALSTGHAMTDPDFHREQQEEEGKVYHGVFELKASGTCTHYLNGKRISSHVVGIHNLKRNIEANIQLTK